MRDDIRRLHQKIRQRTKRAIDRNELARQPCRVCGGAGLAVHLHYDRPDSHVDVDWLCRQHRWQRGQLDLFGR